MAKYETVLDIHFSIQRQGFIMQMMYFDGILLEASGMAIAPNGVIVEFGKSFGFCRENDVDKVSIGGGSEYVLNNTDYGSYEGSREMVNKIAGAIMWALDNDMFDLESIYGKFSYQFNRGAQEDSYNLRVYYA